MYGLRPAKMCLRAYADSESPDQYSLFWAFTVCKQNQWLIQNLSIDNICQNETAHMQDDLNLHILHFFARSRGICWKPRPEAAIFNTSLGTWRMITHWKTMFDRYYCIKTENICYISRYFLHYFVSPFHRCLANAISTDYARSRTGQYTTRNGSKSVAPVRAYWKLRSRALTASELPC